MADSPRLSYTVQQHQGGLTTTGTEDGIPSSTCPCAVCMDNVSETLHVRQMEDGVSGSSSALDSSSGSGSGSGSGAGSTAMPFKIKVAACTMRQVHQASSGTHLQCSIAAASEGSSHFGAARFTPQPAKAWDALIAVLYHEGELFGFLMESVVRLEGRWFLGAGAKMKATHLHAIAPHRQPQSLNWRLDPKLPGANQRVLELLRGQDPGPQPGLPLPPTTLPTRAEALKLTDAKARGDLKRRRSASKSLGTDLDRKWAKQRAEAGIRAQPAVVVDVAAAEAAAAAVDISGVTVASLGNVPIERDGTPQQDKAITAVRALATRLPGLPPANGRKQEPQVAAAVTALQNRIDRECGLGVDVGYQKRL